MNMNYVKLIYDTDVLYKELSIAIESSLRIQGATVTARILDMYGIKIKYLWQSFCDLCIANIFTAESLIVELRNPISLPQ